MAELDMALTDLLLEAGDHEASDDFERAEAKLREAVAMYRAASAPPASAKATLAHIENDLASLLVRRGALDEAEAIIRSRLGDETSAVNRAMLLESLATCCDQRDDLATAERARIEAATATRDVPDRELSTYITAVGHLLRFYERVGRGEDAARARRAHDEALECAIEAVAIGFYLRDRRSDRARLAAGKRPIRGDEVRYLSYGRVTNAETFDADGKPSRNGPRCARIFGPLRDYECLCGAYRGAEYANYVCERCEIEVIPAVARRMRCGHIQLGTKLAHPRWRASVAAWIGVDERAVRTMRDVDDAWSNAAPWSRDQDPLVAALIALPVRDTSDMIMDIVPVPPPERSLPAGLDRSELEAAYATVLRRVEAGDHDALVDAVEALFALFEHGA